MVNPNSVPKVKLNNGLEIPILGIGTWKSKPGEVTQAVKDAIDAGYRHIDCAWIYGNEKEIGEAIKAKIDEKVVKREDLFVVSKLWHTFHKPENVEPALRQSLTALGLDYLDLYLIHNPMDYKTGDELFPVDESGQIIPDGTDYVDTWKAMEEIYKKGLAKSIGISNFNKKQIERVLQLTTVVPVTNQVEAHPYLNQKKLTEYCMLKGITVTAFSPFASPDRPWAKPEDPSLLDDEKLKAIGDKYRKSTAQVILRYLIQRGLIVIPKSVNKKRIEENINIFDFQLTPEDVKYIDTFDRNFRIALAERCKTHPYYPYSDPY